jgi:hypothetical protein
MNEMRIRPHRGIHLYNAVMDFHEMLPLLGRTEHHDLVSLGHRIQIQMNNCEMNPFSHSPSPSFPSVADIPIQNILVILRKGLKACGIQHPTCTYGRSISSLCVQCYSSLSCSAHCSSVWPRYLKRDFEILSLCACTCLTSTVQLRHFTI